MPGRFPPATLLGPELSTLPPPELVMSEPFEFELVISPAYINCCIVMSFGFDPPWVVILPGTLRETRKKSEKRADASAYLPEGLVEGGGVPRHHL